MRRRADDSTQQLSPNSIGRKIKCPRCLHAGVVDDIEDGAVIIRHACDDWHAFSAKEAGTIEWELFVA